MAEGEQQHRNHAQMQISKRRRAAMCDAIGGCSCPAREHFILTYHHSYRESGIQTTQGAVVTVKSISKLQDGKEWLKKGLAEGEAPFEFKTHEKQPIIGLHTTLLTLKIVLDGAQATW